MVTKKLGWWFMLFGASFFASIVISALTVKICLALGADVWGAAAVELALWLILCWIVSGYMQRAGGEK